jgi:uncharacterized caspase-like protein
MIQVLEPPMRKIAYLLVSLTLSVLFFLDIASAAPERRIALVIGNGSYETGPLRNPVNDAGDIAATLRTLGFEVILKKNVRHRDMEEAIEDFGNRLKRGGVGLFYFAGHGVQVNGINYLIPVGARISKESDTRFQAVDAGRILAEMENANNGLNIVLLDACRDNPFGRSFRTASRGLAIVSSAPAGTFISFSTSPGSVAHDGEGRNSPYAEALLQYMTEPGLAIEDVFKEVRQKLRKDTGQIPWELSSLEGKFFFNPGGTGYTKDVVMKPDKKIQETERSSIILDDEQSRIDEERDKIRREKALIEQKEALAREKRELEEKKKQLAMIQRPALPAGVIDLDSIQSLQIIKNVPVQSSNNFKMNLRSDLKMDTWTYDKIPYYMTTSSTKVMLRSPRKVTLAGDAQGRMPWKVDNFLLLETMDSSGAILRKVVIGNTDDVLYDGKVIQKIGPKSFTFQAETIDVTELFPINRQVVLRASAMDYGGLGEVSNIFLILMNE